jgi:hypothetical protein
MGQGVLNIPCTLQKVGTMASGGWRITFDAPETAAAHIRELIGRENNTNFILCLVEVDKAEKPCPPTRKHLTSKQQPLS